MNGFLFVSVPFPLRTIFSNPTYAMSFRLNALQPKANRTAK